MFIDLMCTEHVLLRKTSTHLLVSVNVQYHCSSSDVCVILFISRNVTYMRKNYSIT